MSLPTLVIDSEHDMASTMGICACVATPASNLISEEALVLLARRLSKRKALRSVLDFPFFLGLTPMKAIRAMVILSWLLVAKGHDHTGRGHAKNVSFVYVVGVEGSGHHGATNELLLPLISSRCRDCDTRRLLGCNKNILDDYDHDQLANCLRPAPGRHLFVWEDRSFPAGHAMGHRNAVVTSRLPNFDFGKLYRSIAPFVDVFRLVLLRRDFFAIVRSHGNFDPTPNLHASLMAKHLEFIAKAIRSFPTESYATLPVDCLFVSNETRYALLPPLASFLQIQSHLGPYRCAQCFANWHNQTDHSAYRNSQLDRTMRRIVEKYAGLWGPFAPDSSCDTTPHCSNATFLADPRTCVPRTLIRY